jgi:hypothetical protein
MGDRSRGPCDRQEQHKLNLGSVGHRADIYARGFYNSIMAHYIIARLGGSPEWRLGQRFLGSNHIRQPRRVCRTMCG